MILSHFSRQPFALDPARTYEQTNKYGNGKPIGFWLSDESEHGWSAWCEEEDFRTDTLGHRQDFTIRPGAAVLHLTSAAEIAEFGAEYNAAPEGMEGRHIRSLFLDWERVSKTYAGLLITPYQWSMRNDPDSMWYYGWDCASACIWDLSSIEQVTVDA